MVFLDGMKTPTDKGRILLKRVMPLTPERLLYTWYILGAGVWGGGRFHWVVPVMGIRGVPFFAHKKVGIRVELKHRKLTFLY